MRRLFLLCLLAIACSVCKGGAEPVKVRLARVDAIVDQYIKDEKIAGAVLVVWQNGQPVYERAAGWADKEAGRPMQMDTIFRIASQTKALTSLAAMMLVEEGKIHLNDNVGKYIRPFYYARVAEKKAASADEKKPDEIEKPNNVNGIVAEKEPVILRPVQQPITIHHLLTHTSGISYGTHPAVADFFKNAGLGAALAPAWYLAGQLNTTCQIAEKLGRLPLSSHPGGAWVYGYSTDVLGCIIERVSGVKLDVFFKTRILDKLGMKDTHFFLPPDDRERMATLYASRKGKAERSIMQGEFVDGPRRSLSGGAGLVSTAYDYVRFLELIRNGGALADVRLVKPETIALMTKNQIGGRYGSKGLGFGYGFEVTEAPGAGPDPVGSFGWSGAYGTYYRVVPKDGLVILICTQLFPNGTDWREKFAAAIYQAMAEKQQKKIQ